MYDIIIIGGGPAGATLARLLSPSLSVAMIDKKDFSGQGGFEKCCGGLLNPDAQKAFAKFGLGFPVDIMANPQLFSVRTVDITTKLERFYQRAYINFDRHKFDLWLGSLIPDHVTIIDQARCHSIQKTTDAFTVNYSKEGENHTLQCKYIVGAEGARSLVRDTLFPTPIRQYLSIQQSFPAENVRPYYTCFFHKKLTDCYGWINLKDGQVQLGAALHPSTGKADFEQLRQHFVQEGYPFNTPTKTEACLINRPAKVSEIQTGRDNGFLIGEAAGFVSTSSLEGISYAMESAVILADAFNNSAEPNKRYQKKIKKLKREIFLKILKSIVIYTPPLRWLVMKIGITAITMDFPKEDR